MTTEGAPTSDPDEIRRVYRRSYRLPAAVEDRLYPPLLLGHDPTAFTPGTRGSRSQCSFCHGTPEDPAPPVDCDGLNRQGHRVALCVEHQRESNVWGVQFLPWFEHGLSEDVIAEMRQPIQEARAEGRLVWQGRQRRIRRRQ